MQTLEKNITKTWADDALFYHIYPLGLCGAEPKNIFTEPKNRLGELRAQLEHIKTLGANALYLGPVFESSAHGYDTADYFKVDSRLGTNEQFTSLCRDYKENGIKIVLDGVFNHVGRDFWAFKDVCTHKGYSPYVDWFYVTWDTNNCYDDGFAYEGWEGCTDLVRLNLKNPEVKNHIFEAIRFWVENFDIDGLRLDVAYCLDLDFLRELRSFSKALKPDFWLMGETLHGDYNTWMNPQMLDSVTNYEFFKGFFSSCNDKNLFEIAHSVSRQQMLYGKKRLYTFLDNHDVTRILSNLSDKRDIKLLYTLLFALPGIPSIYYGSEFGLCAKKEQGDSLLRPASKQYEYSELTHHIKHLCETYKENKALALGNFHQHTLTNETYCFSREYEDNTILCLVNISEKQSEYNGIIMPPKSSQLYCDGKCICFV